MFKAILTVCLLAMLSPAAAMALEPERRNQEDSVYRAAWSEDRLWLLSDAGQLFSLTETSKQSRREPVPEGISDMCVMNDRLHALSGTESKAEVWTLRVHSANGWITEAKIDSHGESAFALICGENGPFILTSKRLITLSGGVATETTLHGDMNWGPQTTLVTSDSIYLGINKGEWGGGLRAIDRKTGQVRLIESKGPNLCDGPLNTDCDPVNGLAVVPWRPDCIAAAIGLIHMDSHGSIVTICGNGIKTLYRKQFGEKYPNPDLPPEDAYQTMSFFSLTAVGGKLLAVGGDGLYALGPDGGSTFEAMPKFQKVGPFHVSFALPKMVLVLTSINQRHALSGLTPILVVR